MAILKTTYGSTGSVSYEQAESVLHLGSRKIRIYGDSEGGIHERELSPGDRVEIIDGNAVIHAEDCPDVAVDVNESRHTVKDDAGRIVMAFGANPSNIEWQQVAQGDNVDHHLQKLYHELFVLQSEAQKNLDDRCSPSSERKTKRLDYNYKIRLKVDEIADYLGDC